MKNNAQDWFTPEGMIAPVVIRWVEQHPGSILLETNERGANRLGYLWRAPRRIVIAQDYPEVEPALAEIAHAVGSGLYAAGFISYEAGCTFEEKIPRDRLPDVPLLWFGLYELPTVFDQGVRRVRWAGKQVPFPRGRRSGSEGIRPAIRPLLSPEDHSAAVERIQRYIGSGDTYQVNFTFPIAVDHPGPPSAWYDALRRSQRVAYSAFINTGRHWILSLSPELFFRKKGSSLTLKPMKGTAPRGRNTDEDRRQSAALENSAKDRAENLMIVDLLRNDAGRIAVPGSVRVRRFFDIERYESVFQATSTIQARLRPGVGVVELFRSLFPSGSVTGAPKIRTMQIIRELERQPRGIYTGSIGFFAPSGDAMFNVAIRTAVVDQRTGNARIGVGSGIVHDSSPSGEYAECLLKARFLTDPQPDFELIETILWTPDGEWFLLPFHIRRLRASATYFGFDLKLPSVRRKLTEVARRLRRAGRAAKVRLLVDRQGTVSVSATGVHRMPQQALACLAKTQTNPQDRFLFHKTTRRELYEREFERARERGCIDAVFQNERGEVTEGTRMNVVVRRGNAYFTPPLDSGVLPGTFRAHLFRSRRFRLEEKILFPDDLASADEVFLCNAVQGLVRVYIPELK